jgi:hypothetical protein
VKNYLDDIDFAEEKGNSENQGEKLHEDEAQKDQPSRENLAHAV